MRMKDKMHKKLNDDFRTKLQAAFKKQYGIEITTEFNLFSFRVVSRRVDGGKFTKEHLKFIQHYEDGFTAAMETVSQF